MSYRSRMASADRFDNYAEITARYDSQGTCGHPIKAGDRIGYNRKHGTRCAGCWHTWAAENAEARMFEDQQRYTY